MEPFWVKLLFRDFISHYRKLTAEQVIADIDESMDALETLDDTGTSFGSKMVRMARERENSRFTMAARENGKLGGRPRKDGTRPSQCKPPRDKQEVLDFAADNGLDVDDARLWYERNFIERPGCDRYGEVIRNWKGALVAACKAERERREEENEDDDRF